MSFSFWNPVWKCLRWTNRDFLFRSYCHVFNRFISAHCSEPTRMFDLSASGRIFLSSAKISRCFKPQSSATVGYFWPPVIIKSPCSTQLFPSIPQFNASVFCFLQHTRRLQSSGEEGEVSLRHHTSLHPVHHQCCFRQTPWVKQTLWLHEWRSCVVVLNEWHRVVMAAGVWNLNCMLSVLCM